MTTASEAPTTGTPAAKGHGFPEADVRVVIKHNENSIKSCYERALKVDKRLRNGRLEISVTVGQSGIVKAVSVNAAPEFTVVGACVKEAIQLWRFPAGYNDYEVPFPLVLNSSG